MSPVSRGRKNKKAKKKGPTPAKHRPLEPAFDESSLSPAFQVLQQYLGEQERDRPYWFDMSTNTILRQAESLLATESPRELEQATAELLGAELERIAHANHGGLWFDDWFVDVAESATAIVRENPSEADAHRRLLDGLAAIATPSLAARITGGLPEHQLTATGEVWKLSDAHGSRLGFVAGYEHPDPSVFLFDLEADRTPVRLTGAGVFDDVEQAAAAWRESVGDNADGARPVLVESPEELLPLVELQTDEDSVFGTEPRVVFDNWFRARRRVRELGAATPLPKAPSLYRDFDFEPIAEAFSDWYEQRTGAKPDRNTVDALAVDWLEGVLPEFWHSISPARVTDQLAMFTDDWLPEDPTTIAARALFPDWVRWNGERTGLPEHLIARAVAQATATQKA